MKNVIVGCLISAAISIMLGYLIGWRRANDKAALKEAVATLQYKTVGDSLRDIINRRQSELSELSKKSDSASTKLKQQLATARGLIADLRASTDTPSTPEMKAINACSIVFNTCEQTLEQQREELVLAKSQIASLISKVRMDSLRHDSEKRSWSRRESSILLSRSYEVASKTALAVGAICIATHLRK